MQIDLQYVQTPDGLSLPGAFFAPSGERSGSIDAVFICSGPFHQPFTTTPAAAFAAAGWPTFALSGRGAVFAWSVPGARGPQGAAYERMTDCLVDFSAGIGWLAAQGYRRVAIFGHSIVGLKVLYYAAHGPHPALSAVISSAGLRMSETLIAGSHFADQFKAAKAHAQAMVAAGRGDELTQIDFLQGPQPITPATFLNRYCGEEFDPLRWVDTIVYPVLRVDPDGDMRPGTVNGTLIGNVGDQIMPLLQANTRHERHIVPNADHAYSGGMQPLLDICIRWLRSL